ncbi:MAG: hypothetical protein P8J69_00105 [Flavobacteriaceae bacterium]|nr:hypothetical protein [Flavobacteriaceae bacterium]
MKPIIFKLLGISFLFIFGIQSEITYSQYQKEPYYDALTYRLLGPFRGGRSVAVTGVPNKLRHLNSLAGMRDFPPTEEDVAVKDELTKKINSELEKFNALVSDEIKMFNTEFNSLHLNYLFTEGDTN